MPDSSLVSSRSSERLAITSTHSATAASRRSAPLRRGWVDGTATEANPAPSRSMSASAAITRAGAARRAGTFATARLRGDRADPGRLRTARGGDEAVGVAGFDAPGACVAGRRAAIGGCDAACGAGSGAGFALLAPVVPAPGAGSGAIRVLDKAHAGGAPTKQTSTRTTVAVATAIAMANARACLPRPSYAVHASTRRACTVVPGNAEWVGPRPYAVVALSQISCHHTANIRKVGRRGTDGPSVLKPTTPRGPSFALAALGASPAAADTGSFVSLRGDQGAQTDWHRRHDEEHDEGEHPSGRPFLLISATERIMGHTRLQPRAPPAPPQRPPIGVAGPSAPARCGQRRRTQSRA